MKTRFQAQLDYDGATAQVGDRTLEVQLSANQKQHFQQTVYFNKTKAHA
jgi:carbon monoxide dehydrogenase subunit G